MVNTTVIVDSNGRKCGRKKNFVEIDIYSVNDFHGHLRAEAADPGIAVLSGVINELMKQNPVGSLLLGGGDMFSGTIDANEYQGLPVVTAMNKMGFSANTAGNHIFDYPLDVIKRQAAAANFPILGANIVEAAGDRVAEPFKPYVMLQRNGLTIGILGLTTVETKEKASQFNLQKVKILPPEQIAQVYVDELRRQGAQIIVLLTHIGSSQGEKHGITGEIVPILQKIHGVDAVVTGHSHLCVSGTYGDIPVIQAGCYGEAVGRINLLYSMAAQKVVSANSRIYKLSELPRVQDNAMERFLEPIFKNIDSKYNEILAVNNQVLINDRNGESRVGDFFMDVLKNGFKADVALYNGGAIRDTLPSGRVTVRDLLKIFPFDSTIYTAEVKGSDLRQVLEHGIGNPDISRLRFSGLQISADIRREEGQRISSVTLSDGSTLADEKYYKVISNDFMFSGGDGFYSLQNARHLRDCGKDKTFFAFALRSLKMVDYPAHDERLQIKNRESKMNDFMKLNCDEFLERLASKEPVPGGGGAAALGGAIGAALTSMVANLTVGKEKFLSVEGEMIRLAAASKYLRKELLQLVQEDASVFEAFMKCYKMPKATDLEKELRQIKIQEAAKMAAEIPLKIGEKALAVLLLAAEAAELGNPAVITDAAVAALMARAAVRSAVYNVKINLNLISDQDYCSVLVERIAALEQEALSAEKNILEHTDKVLS